MNPDFETALRKRQPDICARWREMLFVEPVNTPLANPAALSFLIDESLAAVFSALHRADATRPVTVPGCACGRNPYLAYFVAGRQALLEALVLVLAEARTVDAQERDAAFDELTTAINRVARQEIATFGSLCAHPDSHGHGAAARSD